MTTRTACDECRTYDTHLPSCSAGTGATPKVAVFDRTPTMNGLRCTPCSCTVCTTEATRRTP